MKLLFTCYAVAGLFGVLFVQTAVSSLQPVMHSGTQSYVRVVR